MRYKQPVSILVVVYAQSSGRTLLLQRSDNPAFWQSVTGSLEANEIPLQAALREIKEELGVDVMAEGLDLYDCQRQVTYEIFLWNRHRYAPGVTYNLEHWFLLCLPEEREFTLTEHIAARWLTLREAAALTGSISNCQAILQEIKKRRD